MLTHKNSARFTILKKPVPERRRFIKQVKEFINSIFE
jgi:hypothetical protein